MADSYTIESILAADCGATTTRVLLLDVADGQHRFVAQGQAPTSVAPPHNDIVVGVIQAIRQLESITGRRLLDDDDKLIRPERSDGSGVDAFVATVSAAAPLRIVLAGLIPELSIASALRAITQAPALVEGTIFLGEDANPTEQIDLIRRVRPDVVVMVGGTDGSAGNALGALADVVTLASKLLERERRPELVFAGNVSVRSSLAEKVSGLINFHPVDNIRPTLDVEQPGPLVEELEAQFADRKIARLPGFGRLSAWSPVSVTPGSKAFGQIVRFMAEHYSLNVLGVNVGSSQTLLASVVDGNFTLTPGTGWGVGQGAQKVLRDAGHNMVARWALHEEAAESDVIDAAFTKSLYPYSMATTPLELETEQAIAREALRLTEERAMPMWANGNYRPYPDLPPLWDLILVAGGYLTHQPHFGQCALTLLDALQPIGVCTLVADALGLTEVLGAVGAVQPLAAAQVLEHDGLVTLGSLVCPVGSAREGETVMRAKLTYANRQVLNLEIAYGSIEVIPLPAGRKATLELRPSRQFDIGWGRKGRGAVAEVDGGILGIIIDARGRPLQVPQEEEERRRLLQKWRWDIGY
jgi:hypothetical protein